MWKNSFIILFGLLVVLFGCTEPKEEVAGIKSTIKIGVEGRELAFDFCTCLVDNGFTPASAFFDYKSMGDGTENELRKCLKKALSPYMEKFNQLPEIEQKKLVKDFIHALIESSCIIESLDAIPELLFEQVLNY